MSDEIEAIRRACDAADMVGADLTLSTQRLRPLLAALDEAREERDRLRGALDDMIRNAPDLVAAGAESMRRRAVEVCREEARVRCQLANASPPHDSMLAQVESETADRLADEIAALPLVEDVGNDPS